MRPALCFRIAVAGSWFLRVHVHEDRPAMLRGISACHGERAMHEYAATIAADGAPDRGCVADMFFYWRGLRPNVIAHEASHAAWCIALALKHGIAPDADEFIAGWIDRIVEKIWLKTQAAPL